MQKIKILLSMISIGFLTFEFFAAETINLPDREQTRKIIIKNPVTGVPKLKEINRADLENTLEELEEDAERLDKKLKKVKDDSRQSIRLNNEREEISLEIIHRCQRYLLEYGNKKRAASIWELMKRESAMLKTALKNNKDFPFPELFDDYISTLVKIRKNQIPYNGKVPRSNSSLLKEIQEKQEKALEEIHKKNLDNKGNSKKKK